MLEYWVWLTLRKGLGTRGIAELLRRFGTAEAVYSGTMQEYSCIDGIKCKAVDSLLDKDLRGARKILAACCEKGIHLMTCQDAGYPQRLKSIIDPPALLYYKGIVPVLDEEVPIAIVGSRKSTPYGLICAKRFGSYIAGCGCTVVSGGARGADTMALRGALNAGKPVVCVLGCGVDVNYPSENEPMFREIERQGWLVSEFPPGTPPEGKNFPVRNRILSGMCLGVLVVEAGERSGAIITANLALEQGRDVFAIPGNIDSESSRGCNRLIKEGAIVAENGWDVVQEYADRFPDKIRPPHPQSRLIFNAERSGEREAQAASPQSVSPETEEIIVDNTEPPKYIDVQELCNQVSQDECWILRYLAEGKKHVDDIISCSGLSAAKVLSALTMLEVKQYIIRYPGKYFSLALKQE